LKRSSSCFSGFINVLRQTAQRQRFRTRLLRGQKR
jgi:hypothetical protein